ncbi:sucrase ferredoxin [Subtercola sp. RTI3]|uniref:sucrase ferredoxin n=1 Tax=Subtercola sp. RTI3 TaxID=3048639 RepID=UPI002B23159F|nr:sucrase ferredoxin [Subtercola sp. RTI3]MEA9986362.1 sucrase ferredoxin [Subtercola sp. RTI3]
MTNADTAAGWAPCSDRSRERDDPLAATASRGLQWFLVEIDGSWGANAFISSALGRELGQALVHRIESAGMRPLAIRRARRFRAGRIAKPSWRWAFVDSRPGFEEVRWGEVTDPYELLEVPLDGSTGIRSPEPVYCVCTHAKHDQCCAVRGRPVMEALVAAHPDETWECSHLGGDRFAGTMVIFPEGFYFGRADDSEAVGIVDAYRAGRVDERFFRGRSSLSHPVQAAQHYAREHFGVDRLDAFAPLGGGAAAPLAARVSGRAADRASSLAPGETAVLLDHDGVAVRVVVAETLSEPLLSTCAATRFGRVREFCLESITVMPPGVWVG